MTLLSATATAQATYSCRGCSKSSVRTDAWRPQKDRHRFSNRASILTENFDTVVPSGWTVVKRSLPSNPNQINAVFQGNPTVFLAHSGADISYAAMNFEASLDGGSISTWFVSPVLLMGVGTNVTFFTRTNVAPYADRLQVRLSTNIASLDVGSDNNSVGDFATLLLDINPTLAVGAYPTEWTQMTATIQGTAPVFLGRLAFRYYIPSYDTAGNYVGIDDLAVSTAEPVAAGTE